MHYKRFLLFAGDDYYPQAAWADFQDDFDTLEEAKAEFYANPFEPRESWHDWGFIIDLETGDRYHLPERMDRE